ncbi:protein of unknown function [Methylocaldum szegediense]|uniref:Uncharacterized protein n=1 Tax=Methylocaldum szegediense TaxID=73780 RepID=A0ABN8XEX1_9GAMM|nr:protein of unknown function [Methylocaldum szegediense]
MLQRFNPLPVIKPGVTHIHELHSSELKGFNPLPVIKPGVTDFTPDTGTDRERFNPLPVIKPGVTAQNRIEDALGQEFQSTPGY